MSKSLKISFVAPHQNERPAVDQVQKRLFPLLQANVDILQLEADSWADRCFAVRQQMPFEQKTSDSFNMAFSAIIGTYDFASRVSYAYSGLIENKSSIHVEIHAHEPSQSLDKDWHFVPQTQIPFLSGGAFFSLLDRVLLGQIRSFTGNAPKNSFAGFFAENVLLRDIARFFGIDMEKVAGEAFKKLDILLPLAERIIALEVPGKELGIPAAHPAHDYYTNTPLDIFSTDSPMRKGRELLTYSEIAYCTHYYDRTEIPDSHIISMADYLVKRANRIK
ncbi:MAG: hypothetical protein WC861_05600 [Candidatus Micrarchaeia archaeon]|jgi:hypothetical protein